MSPSERNKMIEDNLALVTFSLKKLGVDYNEDYFQQGVLELIRCVDNYDEKKKYKFSTYAVKNITLFLKEYIVRDKVLKPKRYGGTAKVYAPPCYSLDATICEDGKQITLMDAVVDEESNDDVASKLDFFKWDLDLLVDRGLLEEKGKRAIILFYLEGYKLKQVGEMLDLRYRELKKLLNNSLQIIRDNISYNDYNGR